MIVVSGCRRSGTSLWMQILGAAGVPVVGKAFAAELEPLREANPRGFFESEHRYGVVGDPAALRGQALKMFVPGVVEAPADELEAVIMTLRPVHEHVASTRAFEALERDALGEEIPQSMPPALEWWFENYCLLGDFAGRDYPMMIVAYDRVLAQPRETIARALEFVGADGDLDAAVACVQPDLRRADADGVDVDLPGEVLATFAELYARVRDRVPFDDEFVDQLGECHEELMPLIEPFLFGDDDEDDADEDEFDVELLGG